MKKKLMLLLSVLLVLLTGCQLKIEWVTPASAPPPNTEVAEGELSVWFLDVGQGDSGLIRFPNGETMLIDAGESDAAPEILEVIEGEKIEKLDYVIATHPHADHIGGMEQVLKSVEAEQCFLPDKPAKSKTYQNLMEYLEEEKIKVETVKAGKRILDGNGFQVDVVAPLRSDYGNVNDVSVVLRLQYGDKSFLFTGDAQKEAERDILLSGVNIQANVLKVGHHGSDTSSTRGFIRQIAPQYAVISCGEGNSYGHPKPITIETLMAFSVRVYRTDLDGTVKFTTDGKKTMHVTAEQTENGETE